MPRTTTKRPYSDSRAAGVAVVVVAVVVLLVLLDFDAEEDGERDGGRSEAGDGQACEEGGAEAQRDVGVGEGVEGDGGEGGDGAGARACAGDDEQTPVLVLLILYRVLRLCHAHQKQQHRGKESCCRGRRREDRESVSGEMVRRKES